MKIRDMRVGGAKTMITAWDIPIGTVFSGEFLRVASVYLRVYGGVIDLRNPYHVWRMRVDGRFPVKEYVVLNAELVILPEENNGTTSTSY